MRWGDFQRSGNVEDRRGLSPVVAGGGLGIGGLIIVGLISLFFGVDPRVLLQMAPGSAPSQNQEQVTPGTPTDEAGQFVAAVLGQTEETWSDIFRQQGRSYEKPRLVLFRGSTQSGCGFARAQMGPFYCPLDRKLYLDMAFFDELRNRFHAPGEFAEAYVIAHEVGHHVQNLLGILPRVHEAQQRADQVEANQLSVRLELQADCLAGVWANRTEQAKHFLEKGDVESAINAASAIGDDKLQQQARGYVVPDAFTHGSSRQRVTWFTNGFNGGKLESCNTFGAEAI
jgi:predicted metalloprotease